MLLLPGEFGTGWEIARINDLVKLEFIRQAQRGWSDDRGYNIGGGSLLQRVAENISFSQYNPNSRGKTISILLNCEDIVIPCFILVSFLDRKNTLESVRIIPISNGNKSSLFKYFYYLEFSTEGRNQISLFQNYCTHSLSFCYSHCSFCYDMGEHRI